MVVVLTLLASSVALIRLPKVQTFVTGYVTSFLSDQLHTRVEIKSVEITFFKKVILNGLYIEDLHQDTILYVDRLKADISLLDLRENKITLVLVELKNATIGLKRYKEDDDLNIVKLLEQIKSSPPDSLKKTKPWKFNVAHVFLIENNFTYRDLRYNDYTSCIDFDDVVVSHLNGHLSDIRFIGDSVFFNAKDLSLIEKSGFVLHKLNAVTKIAGDEMRFEDISIKTPGTKLKGQLTFMYENFGAFQEFIEKVNFKSKFEKTILDSRDIAYFAKELMGLNKKIVFSGEIRGTVDNIKGKNMDINYLNDTKFKGNVSLKGLPNVEETFIDLLVDNFTSRKVDIESIPAYPFNEPGYITLPDNLSALGKVKFKGKFTGFYNDFVAYGNITTAIGYLSSDINLKFDKNFNKSGYSGNLTASAFDVGKLWNLEKYMGAITCNAHISGTGFKIDKVNAKLEGSVADFLVNGYNYKNIKVDGQIAKKLFSGALTISEDNVNLDFNGKVDFTGELPVFDFYAGIDHAYLSHLNLSKRDTGSFLGCEAFFKFKGSNIDNMTGDVVLKNLNYTENGINNYVDKISLSAENYESLKSLSLKSDIVDAEVKGTYRFSSVLVSMRQLFSRYLPAFPYLQNSLTEPQSFNYSIDFKKTSAVCSLFIPDLVIAPGSSVRGAYNSTSEEFNLQLNSHHISYGVIDLKKINLIARTQNGKLKAESTIDELFLHDSLKLGEIQLVAETNKDLANFSVLIADNDTLPNSLKLVCQAVFNSDGKTFLRILPSKIRIDSQNWLIDPDNSLLWDSSGLKLANLNFTSGTQNISVNGLISKEENQGLEVGLVNFNTSILNKILKIYDISLGGTANGITRFNAVAGKMKMEANIEVKNFSFFSDTLGDAYAIANWNTALSVIEIDGHIDRDLFKNIEVKGRYIIKEKNDSLDFSLSLKKFPVQTFNHYLEGVASDARGLLNADVKLFGTVNKPVINGKGNFQKTSFKIDYLNTRYNFADEFIIDDKQIAFEHIVLNDAAGNTALVSGNIYHNYLKDFFFAVKIHAKNFECLNTTASMNDLFYGHAFASGNVKISGDLDFINMDISLKTEKGTLINLPLSNPIEVKNKEFINFVSASGINKFDDKFKVDLKGIDMTFDFDVTTDAEIKLIFDEKIGDIITGRGSGNISMTIDPQGAFSMYGDYEIQSGNYLFTLQNLINKDFKIVKGGTLKWNGDPYDALINIEAIYRLNAVLNDLIQDTSASNYNKRYPVEVKLNLTEKLFNPKIDFEINIPNIDPTTESVVTRYMKTQEEINKQVFSLLLTRRFSKPREFENSPNTGSTTNPVGENAAELLSSQVSQWISQISKDFDLGVNYRPGNQGNKDEFEVMVSTNILNDRVTIDGNVGVANDNQNSSNIVGDFNIEYKVSPDGRFRVKAFNKSNNNSLININNSLYTQGIGIFYRRDFDSWNDLLKSYREKQAKKKTEKENK